jgi:hypothetical protein
MHASCPPPAPPNHFLCHHLLPPHSYRYIVPIVLINGALLLGLLWWLVLRARS